MINNFIILVLLKNEVFHFCAARDGWWTSKRRSKFLMRIYKLLFSDAPVTVTKHAFDTHILTLGKSLSSVPCMRRRCCWIRVVKCLLNSIKSILIHIKQPLFVFKFISFNFVWFTAKRNRLIKLFCSLFFDDYSSSGYGSLDLPILVNSRTPRIIPVIPYKICNCLEALFRLSHKILFKQTKQFKSFSN